MAKNSHFVGNQGVNLTFGLIYISPINCQNLRKLGIYETYIYSVDFANTLYNVLILKINALLGLVKPSQKY